MRQSVLMTPEAMMQAGNEILRPVLEPAGFEATPMESGHGSGGDFAVERWVRGSQFIEVHCRYALGIVRYGWADEEFDHARVAGALRVSTSYPGFSDDPLDGFRHLADDLAGPLSAVLTDEGDQVLEQARGWVAPARKLP